MGVFLIDNTHTRTCEGRLAATLLYSKKINGESR